MEKEELAPLYIPGCSIIGDSKDLLQVYDIMHRVFRNVLMPKVWNQHEIHGYLVDLLGAMHIEAGSGATIDVSKWMWEEMYNMVINRKVPIYALFVMCFFVVGLARF
ncbi:dna replication licensing factor mcm4 [Hordeum vulgare]|nr:dna replication licensing factor mcm4 [Hordeum vulgare]